MLIDQIWAMVPSRRHALTVVLSSVFGGALAIGTSTWLLAPAGPPPNPGPPHDPRFVPIGQAYVIELGKAYAAAWDEGAKGLDAGQPLSTSLDAVAKAWSANRAQLFDQTVTPEFSKLIPEATKDADVTPSERAAMAAAWRGLALGLKSEPDRARELVDQAGKPERRE